MNFIYKDQVKKLDGRLKGEEKDTVLVILLKGCIKIYNTEENTKYYWGLL